MTNDKVFLKDDQVYSSINNRLITLIALNTTLLVASNAAGSKMVQLPFGFAASATVFSYALTFTIMDVISEVYGKKVANLAVRVGFMGLVVSVLFFSISIIAPAASFWKNQAAYEQTLGLGFRLLLGGWLSYLVSQHTDVYIFHLIKKSTGGKALWLRKGVSTIIGQLIDTIIFMTIAFYGMFPLLPAILGQYVIKLIIAILDTPIVYAIAYFVEKKKKHSSE